MRVNRAKFVRKYLRFFKIVFGISPPFDIILDGNFIFAALKVKLDIQERLAKLMQGETIRIHVLKSVLAELAAAGSKTAAALEFAKTFCEVIDDTMFDGETPCQKLKAMLVKQHRDILETPSLKLKIKNYFVASQDKDLRTRVGSVPGIPLIYLNKVTLVMEPPSQDSRDFSKKIESSKVVLSTQEEIVVENLLKKSSSANNVIGNYPTEVPVPTKPLERKKRKASAANPLSSMKASEDSNTSKKKKTNKFSRS